MTMSTMIMMMIYLIVGSMKSGATIFILLTALVVVSDSLFYPELGTETSKNLQKSIRQHHKTTNQVSALTVTITMCAKTTTYIEASFVCCLLCQGGVHTWNRVQSFDLWPDSTRQLKHQLGSVWSNVGSDTCTDHSVSDTLTDWQHWTDPIKVQWS